MLTDERTEGLRNRRFQLLDFNVEQHIREGSEYFI